MDVTWPGMMLLLQAWARAVEGSVVGGTRCRLGNRSSTANKCVFFSRTVRDTDLTQAASDELGKVHVSHKPPAPRPPHIPATGAC
jgi:hypothetical protein